MQFNGEERGLALTVRGLSALSALCPDGKIERLGDVFEGIDSGDPARVAQAVSGIAGMVAVMSECYEKRRANETGEPMREPITAEQVLDMDLGSVSTLAPEITDAAAGALNTEVRTKAKKRQAAGKAAH